MKIKLKICSGLISSALILVAPAALAQIHNSDAPETIEPLETIQLGQEENSQKQSPASWHGKDVALRGRDVVSFFADSGPVKGSKKYAADWDGTKWHFSNQENRDAFKADPKKYIPEFGGYCPVALSRGEVKIGRTNQFTRIDDKLYLNYNSDLKREFGSNPDDYILKAQVSW